MTQSARTVHGDAARERAPLGIVVFLAGFAFLIQEVVWHRLLTLTLGATVTAATLVLATFMAGFGAGAATLGRVADRTRAPWPALGALLAVQGGLGGLAYVAAGALLPRLGAGLAHAVAALLLLVASIPMGGLYPFAARLAAAARDPLAPALGRLYALETAGSALGGLVAGFVLLGALGQNLTLAVACALAAATGIWLWMTRRPSSRAANSSTGSGGGSGSGPDDAAGATGDTTGDAAVDASPARQPAAAAHPVAGLRWVLTAAFAGGFTILALQIVWMRIFRIYLANTSYTFALIASVVILGLAAGAAIHRRPAVRLVRREQALKVALLLLAASALAGLPLLARLPQILMFPLQEASASVFVRIVLLPLVAALFVVLPPAVCSGFAFPLACDLAASGRDPASGTTGRSGGGAIDRAARLAVGRSVGLVLAVNTLGCVLGPLVAAFALIPLAGAAVSVVAIAVVPLAAAWPVGGSRIEARGATLRTRGSTPRPARSAGTPVVRTAAFPVLLAVLLAVVLVRPQIRILPPSFGRFDRDILFYHEGVEGTVSVGRDRDTRSEALYTFVNNSAVIGSSYDAIKVVKMVGHFPFLVNPDLRDVLVIGFGIGVTTSAIASHPSVASITCVELVPALSQAATYYRDLNRDVVRDPRLSIVAGDGRRHLQATRRTFDLISCDPTHPVLGSGSLYTREYFTLCRARLNPGGLVSQYLPLHKLRTEELVGLLATFADVFPDCAVWLGHHHAVLLGSVQPLRIDHAEWSARCAALGSDRHFYHDPDHLAATLVLDGPAIARLAAGVRRNTDDHSTVEFFPPGSLDDANLPANLRFLQQHRAGVETVFTAVTDPARLQRFVEGHRLLIDSLIRQTSGDPGGGLQALQQACRVNPENQEYPFLIQLLR